MLVWQDCEDLLVRRHDLQSLSSSTSQDLVAHRKAVLAAIDGLDGFTPIAMEGFGARAAPAVEFDDRRVLGSDVLVGPLGLCYGSNPRMARLRSPSASTTAL